MGDQTPKVDQPEPQVPPPASDDVAELTADAKGATSTAQAAGDDGVACGAGKRPKDRPKRSVALHTGYVGTGFKGSSINRTLGDNVTIEQVLEKALFAAGCITEANFGSFSKIRWTRASRTDKGVHSLGTVMGLRMHVDDARYVTGPGGDPEGLAIADLINEHLPPQIRVFCVQKTNKKFSARHMCEGRVYQYYLPASMLELKGDGSEEDAARLATFRDALKCFEGYHAFHNYTRRQIYQPGGPNVQFKPARAAAKRKREEEEEEKGADAAEAAAAAAAARGDAAAAGGNAASVAAPATAGADKCAGADAGADATMAEASGPNPDAGAAAPAAAADGGNATAAGAETAAEVDPWDRVMQSHYRRIHSFTAADPVPLVEGGTPCLLLEVSGQSFMLHHIRHMIGTAVAVALGLLPRDVLQASLHPPARVTLPRAPPHTLLLADCSFGRFPQQYGPGDNDLRNVTGERLSIRAGGVARREEFRAGVLAPALQSLVELPEWGQWLSSLRACYPFPQIIKRNGRPVLPAPVREVRSLPPQRYGNGAVMYGVRVVAVGGAFKDIYTDDCAALDAWATDLSRCTPAAREAAFAAAEAAAAAAAPPLSAPTPPPPPPPRQPGAELRLADICETDWSHMLGSGLFACVMRGRMHCSGEPVAVKVIKTEAYQQYSEMVQREAAVWSAVGAHPHIVQLKQVLRSSERMYFISELCEGGSLVGRLAGSATYCEREVAWLMRQLLSAVGHLHANAIVHMDIKPENLVFASRREDSVIKLIDFSLSSFFYTPTDPGGTPDFVAPELLNTPELFAKNGCGPEVDMWAVGVMLFFLLSGQTPFQAPSLELVLQRVKSGEWAFHGRRWALISDGARELVSHLLRREPSERLTAAEALAHPWLRRPDSLSQALLADAVAAFRTAAAAAQAQLRTSWVKQGSTDILASAGTNGTAASPLNSLSRFATAVAGVANGSGVGPTHSGSVPVAAAAAITAINDSGSPASSGAAASALAHLAPYASRGSTMGAVMDSLRRGSGGGAGSGGLMMTSSASYSVAPPALGGPSGRASRNSMLRYSGYSAAHTSAGTVGGGGYLPAPLLHSFTAGASGLGGNSAHTAAAAAAAAVLGHAHSTGSRPGLYPTHSLSGGGNAPAGAAGAIVRSSPLGSPHHSPGSGAQPRSPLGLTRVRRASDTMAYTLAMKEQQESISQMQAQGIDVPPVTLAAAAAKARRASDMSNYALGASGVASVSGEGAPAFDPAAAAGAAAAAAAAGGSVAALERRHPSPHGGQPYHPHPHHHSHNPPLYPQQGQGQQRAASGLSVMTGGSSAAAAALSGDGRPTGGRSNPELMRMQSM
ncbi:hypothetical protein GPECTOR_12g565 [Gonium pectorale]|uniref:Protein kinase domain-containing protein n=1 Tax=Gonium pectorale TaxID=33097 RepID=A0A150GP66_GONPE|nr:hypothetical protein GPECTOR_12g565 [Gonium pectorale]|eukprot:KXZ51601.1 hypothetical protein GPECTOR_12g565 [Gonium pectorale]